MDSVQTVTPSLNKSNKTNKRKVFKTRKQKRFERQKAKNVQNNRTSAYSEIIKENKSFETYYKKQKFIHSDDEWNQFMEILREALPSSFRISSFCAGQAEKIRDLIQNELSKGISIQEEGENVQPDISNGKNVVISPMPWYPNNLAWTINLSKVEIRKSPQFAKLHEFLISETETGDISRQEAVSMIPPLLLDVRSGHSVLDMCAAPGSKTAQIIEMLHQESSNNFIVDQSAKDGKPVDGLVVANDVDNRRCYMLVHQSKRLHSPSVVITNHDASTMPNFYKLDNDNQKVLLKFDRVLADVPCSGDGTMRKNYDVWPKWNVANSNNFHYLQIKIAKRGLELLAKDGIMAYSTCSLNPIEDEAVISTLLNLSEGGLELLDASKMAPELKCHPGLDTWTVMSRDDQVLSSFDDVPENLQSQIRESLFPPKNASELNLKYCIRVLPHYQNTGGFFIAILKKKVDKMPWESSNNSTVNNDSDKTKVEFKENNQRKKKKGYQGHREDPFYFLDENDSEWPSLKTYYNFPDKFSYKNLAHRCTTGKRRNIYYLTDQAANFIINNPHVKLITGGSRIFNRVDVKNIKCSYRITQEGIPSLFPYFTANLGNYLPDFSSEEPSNFCIIEVDLGHFVKLLKYEDLKIEDFDKEIRPTINKLSHGCCALYVKLERPEPNKSSKFILPICAWKGRNSIRAYVAKNDRTHLLRLCGVQIETSRNNSKEISEKRSNNDDELEVEKKSTVECHDTKRIKIN